MKVIGITGPSGSGKSKISQIIRDNDYSVIDVDKIARDVRPKHAEDIRKAFGDDYVTADGEIDTKKLGLLVFGNSTEMERLNQIMFPSIFKEMRKLIEVHEHHGADILFFDIAVLFNSGAEKFFDKIVLVTASRLTRMERLINLRKVDPLVAAVQVDSVFITHDEIGRCDLVIVNEGNKELDLKITLFGWLKNL
jgi:dephospho-CoA kinase